MKNSQLRWIAVGLAAVLASLLFRGADGLINKPFTEDGFYALAVARNIGTGLGVTIDGETWTNGFQPLWVFVTAPVYAITGGASVGSLYGVVLLHLLCYLATAILLRRVVSGAFGTDSDQPAEFAEAAGWCAAVLYLGSIFVLEQHLNGLETGLYLLILIAAARLYQTGAHRSARGSAALGALLGLLVLARIDSVFLVIILSTMELLSCRRDGVAAATTRFALMSGAAFLVSSPWWAYNVLGFGSLMPISGTAQQWWSLDPDILAGMRTPRAYHALMQLLVPWAPTLHIARVNFPLATAVRLALIGLASVTIYLSWTRRPVRLVGSEAGRSTMRFGAAVVTWIAFLMFWYVLSSGASHFYERYWAPLLLLSAGAWAIAACALLPRRVVIIGTAALALSQVAAVFFMHTGAVFRGNEFYKNQLALVREYAGEDALVAAAQTGTLGYFHPHVVNLDGKVNPEAVAHRGRMLDYLREQNVGWFVDWPNNAHLLLGHNTYLQEWERVATDGRFELLRRRD